MAIEILENTLLKLLVRRGTNHDRQQITLESGELGYATDTKRLFIGDGVTKGGILVGNKWAGEAADLTTLAPVASGDYAYDTDNREFRVCIKGSGAVASDWQTVATYVSAADTTIIIGASNGISVGTLSAGNFSSNALGNSLVIDGSEKIALSARISVDSITRRDTGLTSYLSLPSKLQINSLNYTFPTTSPQADTFLGYSTSDNAGQSQLAWMVPKVIHSAVAPTTAALIPIGTIAPYAAPLSGAPYGWLNCNGQYVDAVTYSELLTAINGQYGRRFSDNTFAVPNLSSTALYGYTEGPSPAGSSLVGITSAHSSSPGVSARGVGFIIKAFNGVTNPTMTVGKNLSATLTSGSGLVTNKTDISFNPLSGELKITRPVPGQRIFTQPGVTHYFEMPGGVTFVKFYVTGSGSHGDKQSGNAAATAIGYLSAAPGKRFPVEVASAPNFAQDGNASYIYDPADDGTILIKAPGGEFRSHTAQAPTINASSYLPSETISVLGGVGGIDTDGGGKEEDNGGAGYWGHAPAYGGGGGSHADDPQGPPPTDGVVIFEWN